MKNDSEAVVPLSWRSCNDNTLHWISDSISIWWYVEENYCIKTHYNSKRMLPLIYHTFVPIKLLDNINPITNSGFTHRRRLQMNVREIIKKNAKDSKVSNTIVDIAKTEIYNTMKYSMGVELSIPLGAGAMQYPYLMEFLKEYDTNWKNHATPGIAGGECIRDKQFFIKFRKDTYALIQTGRYLMKDEMDLFLYGGNGNNEVYANTFMKIYIFGKKCHAYRTKIEGIVNRTDYSLSCFKISSNKNNSYTSNYQKLLQRKFNTIFFENGVIEDLKDHIDKFLSTKKLYTDRNIIYKTGILLKGEPGTGKTSLANAIASEYGCDLVIINMSQFAELNVEELTSSLNSDDAMYVILLEDIDCVIADREDDKISDADKKTINTLLQFLDSNSSPTNVIFVATTNYPEKLDKAITRKGRFDLTVNVNGIGEERAIDMCKSFELSDDKIKTVLSNMKTHESYNEKHTYKQSELQAEILSTFETMVELNG